MHQQILKIYVGIIELERVNIFTFVLIPVFIYFPIYAMPHAIQKQ